MSTGIPHKPTKIEFRIFKRGQIVSGVLVEAHGQPAYVLKDGTFVLPLSNIKEMVTKDVSYSVEGDKKKPQTSAYPAPKKPINTKVKYADKVLIGTAVGIIVSFIGVKKNWWTGPEDKKWLPYVIGAGVGAGLGFYWSFRSQNKNKIVVKQEDKTK